jgi:hypothetical protein
MDRIDDKKPLARRNRRGRPADLDQFMPTSKSAATAPTPGVRGARQHRLRHDRQGTGALAAPDAPGSITKAFIAGTQPGSGFPRQ